MVVEGGDFFAFFDKLEFGLGVGGGELLSFLDHGGEAFGPFFGGHGHGAHVKDEVVGVKLGGEFERFERHFHGALAVVGAV